MLIASRETNESSADRFVYVAHLPEQYDVVGPVVGASVDVNMDGVPVDNRHHHASSS